jgi:plastocyanin
MTWLLRISFSFCWLLPALGAPVNGTIRLINSRDPEVRKNQNFSGVVVWLEPLGHGAATFSAKTINQPAVMAQKVKTFSPHVLALPAGTAVEFPNFDPIFHNAFSSYSGQVFDVGLYPPGRTRTVVFKREGVVRVFCNIHSSMSAVIVVLKTPYFAVSDPSGSFTIADVPPGDYRLHVYHERALPQTLESMECQVKVPGEGLLVPQLVISETGYVLTPHQNKFGREYPSTEDQLLYPRDAR